ncbi:hypothetical protein T190607A02C_20499 [Tenacibaculum sp. 190524A02b]
MMKTTYVFLPWLLFDIKLLAGFVKIYKRKNKIQLVNDKRLFTTLYTFNYSQRLKSLRHS